MVDVSRRRALLALAGIPVAGMALASCSETHPAKRRAPHHHPDRDSVVRWRAIQLEQRLLARHAETVTHHPELEDLLGTPTAHHRAHLEALLDDGPLPRLASVDDASGVSGTAADGRTSGSGTDTGPGDAGPGETGPGETEPPEIPANPGDALAAIRDAERTASDLHITECVNATSPRLAALLGSLAAAEAAHDADLDGGAA
ncbi:hypothetical protein EF847_08680 [Actinobacteria bacterium YIM 96077]|uniref:DUF305 domain-containing protein n=2 Tax=Phytoactinopolyspora halophila TaxID=1981511 RepID=A0A329QWA3_9ACTN|nr:hypothetical protein EF847_08680 [Actinobacteria bacterium YIM 96077]RAW16431.1 hypothetical protein DPM12_07340 [Phytoactinopolyspora halophila]